MARATGAYPLHLNNGLNQIKRQARRSSRPSSIASASGASVS
jgi:hypothetical protein